MVTIFFTSCVNGGSNESSTQNETSKLDEVTIGNQVWITKNLNVYKFRNGDTIPQAKTDAEWKTAGKNKQPAWCYYDNDTANGSKYGKLYKWYAVIDARGLAPDGYHIPTDKEWATLVNYLGHDAGNKMKSKSDCNSDTTERSKTCTNCVNWSAEYRSKVPCHTCKDTRSVSVPAKTNKDNYTNSSGFSGLPGGGRNEDGKFYLKDEHGFWWSSTYATALHVWSRGLDFNGGFVDRGGNDKERGLSVRCLRD